MPNSLKSPWIAAWPGSPVLHYLPEFAQIHVHRVGDAPSPYAFNLPQYQGLFHELALLIRWPKYWRFSFSISSFNEYSGLISFRNDWFDLLVVQVTRKSFLQHHSLKASMLWQSAFFMVTSVHYYWKNHSLTVWIFVSKVMCLLLIHCLGLS